MREVDEVRCRQEVWDRWCEVVTMTAAELRAWLDADTSGGHQPGRGVMAILEKARCELTDDDVAQMREVLDHVARLRAQRPEGEVRDTPWRRELMGWGHDPVR